MRAAGVGGGLLSLRGLQEGPGLGHEDGSGSGVRVQVTGDLPSAALEDLPLHGMGVCVHHEWVSYLANRGTCVPTYSGDWVTAQSLPG